MRSRHAAPRAGDAFFEMGERGLRVGNTAIGAILFHGGGADTGGEEGGFHIVDGGAAGLPEKSRKAREARLSARRLADTAGDDGLAETLAGAAQAGDCGGGEVTLDFRRAGYGAKGAAVPGGERYRIGQNSAGIGVESIAAGRYGPTVEK